MKKLKNWYQGIRKENVSGMSCLCRTNANLRQMALTNLSKKFDMSGKLFYKQLLKVVVDLLHIYSNSYYIKPEIKCVFTLARSKTRKPWKSQKSRKFFSEIFKSEFTILATGQNRKLGNKKTRNNFSEISDFSDFCKFSICHFFIFQKKFFSIF